MSTKDHNSIFYLQASSGYASPPFFPFARQAFRKLGRFRSHEKTGELSGDFFPAQFTRNPVRPISNFRGPTELCWRGVGADVINNQVGL
jgi:hypothetical protein